MDDIIPRCILLLVYTIAGAFFSAGETALSYCNAVRIRLMADNGDRRAKNVVRLLDRFDEAVVALLIGVNILHVVAAASATVLFVGLLGTRGAGVATVVMTLVIFIFSETIPKNIANANADAWILRTAGIILFFDVLFRPLVLLLSRTGEAVRSLLHISDSEPSITEDEFATLVEGAASDGLLEENESDIIRSSIEFGDVLSRSVMTPREKIVALDVHASPEEVRDFLLDLRFSRCPVCDGDLDHVVGVLLTGKSLYRLARGETLDLHTQCEKPLFLPADGTAADAFQEMRQRKTHFAILRDESDRTVGVLTMDDILEEIVDDIDEISAAAPEGGDAV